MEKFNNEKLKHHPSTASLERKVSSFRQQIWMGIPIRNTENGMTVINNDFGKVPLSWGISSLALTSCNSKSEIFLRSINEQTISKYKKDVGDNNSKDEKVKETKKERSRLKWEMTVNLNSTIKDNNGNNKNSFLSIKADSLKLFTSNTPTKKERRQQKLETQIKSHHQNVATTERIIARNKITKIRTIQQLKSFAIPVSDSSNSEECLNNMNKLKNGNGKQKKKKQLKKTKIIPNSISTRTGNKKRAASAKIVKKFIS
ncbi:PREDICTED: uncharacterized protein LOC107065599 [Polistes dominula]|uniref:Uncharacterized protein LOC107065599 n=1 Tax=Polistes dominula TaxID=743375 RepID=A0ABM1I3Z6_POLDO|nr:PREDICTED: uncharacterized protein LOC107065599 [Polistes dominula]